MLTPLLSPRHGTPEIVATESDFEKVITALLKGEGPIAIDAERASGYRYSQRAYLIQIYRKGGGLHLIDPIPLKDSKLWQRFNTEFSDIEWVIHASTQDLPCLIEVGLKPSLNQLQPEQKLHSAIDHPNLLGRLDHEVIQICLLPALVNL